MDWIALGFVICVVAFVALCILDFILSAVGEATWGRRRKR